MSPKKFRDMKYKVQRGPNGDHKLVREPSHREKQSDDATPKRPSDATLEPPTPPVTGFEITLPMDGRHFESDVFILHVGGQGHQVTAHESILVQSPVLRAKCISGRQTKRITLPDFEIDIFRLVIQYLYARTFNESVLGTGTELAKGLAKLYVLGSKLWLGSITALVINRFKEMEFLESHPELLLHIGSKIYGETPPADRAFKEFFVVTLVKCHEKAKHRFPKRKVLEYVQRGGPFATDIHHAQQRYEEMLEGGAARAADPGRRRSQRDEERSERLRLSGYFDSEEGTIRGSAGNSTEGSRRSDRSARSHRSHRSQDSHETVRF